MESFVWQRDCAYYSFNESLCKMCKIRIDVYQSVSQNEGFKVLEKNIKVWKNILTSVQSAIVYALTTLWRIRKNSLFGNLGLKKDFKEKKFCFV